VDNRTGFEKHAFDDDDEEDHHEQDDGEDDEEHDILHYGDDGFEDEYPEEEEEDGDSSWTDVGDIHPEESASYSRAGPSRSRRYPPVSDPPRPKARGKYPTVVDPSSGQPPRRGGRSTSRRPPRPRSVADQMDSDEFLYGRPYPPWGGSYTGYAPSKYVKSFCIKITGLLL